MFALLEGFQPRPIASQVIDLNAADAINIVNDSGQVGALLTMSVHVKTAPTGAPVLNIGMVVDGASIWTQPIYQGSTTFARENKTIRQDGEGTGANVGDWFTIGFNFGFVDSLVITAGPFSLGTATGEVYVEVWRAWKTVV